MRERRRGWFDIGSSAISMTEERKKTVAFSAPYNFRSLGIVAAAGSPVQDENTLGVFDLATAETYAEENPDPKLTVVHSLTTDLPHGFAFKKGNTELIDKVDAGLKQVIEDGTWERLHRRFEPNAPTPAEFAAK